MYYIYCIYSFCTNFWMIPNSCCSHSLGQDKSTVQWKCPVLYTHTHTPLLLCFCPLCHFYAHFAFWLHLNFSHHKILCQCFMIMKFFTAPLHSTMWGCGPHLWTDTLLGWGLVPCAAGVKNPCAMSCCTDASFTLLTLFRMLTCWHWPATEILDPRLQFQELICLWKKTTTTLHSFISGGLECAKVLGAEKKFFFLFQKRRYNKDVNITSNVNVLCWPSLCASLQLMSPRVIANHSILLFSI